MNLRREIFGMKFKGEKICDYKIEETLKRKGERGCYKIRESNMGEICIRG